MVSKPNIVIIELGTNDSKPQNWKYKSNFYNDYVSMIDTFANLDTHPRIILWCPPKVFIQSGGITDTIIGNQIVPLVKKIAADKGLEVIDFYAITTGHPELSADGIHFAKGGCYMVSKKIYETIFKTKLTTINDENVNFNKPINASTFIQEGVNKYSPDLLNDGYLNTKWKAKGLPATAVIDLNSSQTIDAFQLSFVDMKKGYQYKIESSTDSSSWDPIVDQTTRIDTTSAFSKDTIVPKLMRYIKLTITGFMNSASDTVSLYEFKALKYTGFKHASPYYVKLTSPGTIAYSYTKPDIACAQFSLYTSSKTGVILQVLSHDTSATINFKMHHLNANPFIICTDLFYDTAEIISDSSKYYIEPVVAGIDTKTIQSSEISVFPNPFSDELTITNLKFTGDKGLVDIYSVDGKLLKILNYSNNDGSTVSLKWDGTDMLSRKVPSGIYLIEIINEQQRSVTTVIKK